MAPSNVKHVPTAATRSLVSSLTGFGIEQEHIASELGISPRCLRTHYKKEVDNGTSKIVARVAAALYKKATDPKGGMPSVTAAIFMLKARARWRDVSTVEHTGQDGAPLPTNGATSVQIILPDNGRDHPSQLRGARVVKQIEARPTEYAEIEIE